MVKGVQGGLLLSESTTLVALVDMARDVTKLLNTREHRQRDNCLMRASTVDKAQPWLERGESEYKWEDA